MSDIVIKLYLSLWQKRLGGWLCWGSAESQAQRMLQLLHVSAVFFRHCTHLLKWPEGRLQGTLLHLLTCYSRVWKMHVIDLYISLLLLRGNVCVQGERC